MSYILAIDAGTSSTRAMIYSDEGVLICKSHYELSQYYPEPGLVEHDPEEIWKKTLQAINDVAETVGTHEIQVMGITNQRETTVVWNKKTGECLHRAIVWQDRRTQSYCDSLIKFKKMLQEKTGLRPDPYFSATKLKWLLDNIPEAQALAKTGDLAFGTIDSFLIWRLTRGEVHATDITNASRTMLYNIFEHKWDEELLELFNIPDTVLPKVLPCDARFGSASIDHIGYQIPIHGVAGDQHAALIGQNCMKPGTLKATYGTGGFLLKNTGTKAILSRHQLLTTIAYQINGQVIYGLEGSIYQAGTIIKWLRDEMNLIQSAEESEILASQLKDNGGVYIIPSFTGLGAPYWLSTEGAIISGIRRNTKPAHFVRAALECVTYQSRDVIQCMIEDTKLDLTALRVDGGMTNNQWFLNHLSSQLNIKVEKPRQEETTVWGAAILAGIGIGIISSGEDEFFNHDYDEIIFSEDRDKVARDYSGWVRAIKTTQ